MKDDCVLVAHSHDSYADFFVKCAFHPGNECHVNNRFFIFMYYIFFDVLLMKDTVGTELKDKPKTFAPLFSCKFLGTPTSGFLPETSHKLLNPLLSAARTLFLKLACGSKQYLVNIKI